MQLFSPRCSLTGCAGETRQAAFYKVCLQRRAKFSVAACIYDFFGTPGEKNNATTVDSWLVIDDAGRRRLGADSMKANVFSVIPMTALPLSRTTLPI